MNPLLNRSLVFLLTLGTVSSAMTAQELGHGKESGVTRELFQSEGKEDPPGVVNQRGVESLSQLALQLSLDRSWLTGDVLKGFDTMSLRLNEIFAGAPNFIEVEGKLYRLVLEKVGPGWHNFGPRSNYLVFLNHEAYDKLGENYALAFENGRERIISLEDLKKNAAISLTLQDITPDERPRDRRGVVGLESTIQLGKVRPKFRSERALDIGKLLAGNKIIQKSCEYVSAPIACSNGVPVCASGSASPYFLLSALMIKVDNEGAFKGNPEVELYPLRINPYSPYGGSTDVRTDWQFDGRYVTDPSGRYVYLPDVNNTWQWYYLNNGLALFPSNLSNEWVGTLVENDDDRGRLNIDRNRSNTIKLPVGTIVSHIFDNLDFLKGLSLVITLGFLNDSDDLWYPSLAVNNDLFCSSGVGQPLPYTYYLSGDEWDMQGYFACIDPACVPDPCGGDPCCGDPCCGDPCCTGTGICN